MGNAITSNSPDPPYRCPSFQAARDGGVRTIDLADPCRLGSLQPHGSVTGPGGLGLQTVCPTVEDASTFGHPPEPPIFTSASWQPATPEPASSARNKRLKLDRTG